MRTSARKAALALAGATLAVGTLAGCGGGDDGEASSAPDDASQEDFCAAFAKLYQDVLGGALDDDSSLSVKGIKDWAEDMAEVGTPEDMPDEARKGFEVFLDAARDLPDDATLDDLETFGDDLSEADQKAGDEFGTWAATTCGDQLLPDLPTELPSDLPSDLASELPSDLPSDLESMMSDLPTDPSELESMMSELTASLGAG